MADYKTYSIENLEKDIKELLKLREFRRTQGDDLSETNIRALVELQIELSRKQGELNE